MQQALEWQEILEVFYNFDKNEVYPLPNVSGINETALKLGICARLHHVGFQTEASRLWGSLVSDLTAANQQECNGETGESMGKANSSHPMNVPDSESKDARTPPGSDSDTCTPKAVHTSSGDKGSTTSVGKWLADNNRGEETAKTHPGDNPIQHDLNAAPHQAQQLQALTVVVTSSDNSDQWLNNGAFRREQ
ncbi:hypothetical protein BWQ96_05866 [Gracilariopsis chorda]|uniref:Uncharacterized protein n=1 Tax=Gracilariopsis chorda TaxID=448386 RepID=A0A2V3IQQ8_9FLOR|nr:hypothetical protein BWQ96_05866 [Gracilariopsis chorda]|eukprot:PXF44423.1 hypothetical protein BWQ96_05866 [Gracilariopsis chorda]